jgi:hypothetical protein
VWCVSVYVNLDIILCSLAQVDAAVSQALFNQVLVLGALLVMLPAGLVVGYPDFAVSAEPLGSRNPLFGHNEAGVGGRCEGGVGEGRRGGGANAPGSLM